MLWWCIGVGRGGDLDDIAVPIDLHHPTPTHTTTTAQHNNRHREKRGGIGGGVSARACLDKSMGKETDPSRVQAYLNTSIWGQETHR